MDTRIPSSEMLVLLVLSSDREWDTWTGKSGLERDTFVSICPRESGGPLKDKGTINASPSLVVHPGSPLALRRRP